MIGTAARSGIVHELEDAIETAGAYLRALGVLDAEGIWTSEQRRRDFEIMEEAILKSWPEVVELPRDPFARDAVKLAHLYLRYGGDSSVLDDLLQKDRRHPAYRRALTILVRALRDSGAEIPERLRRWEQEPGEVQGRWTPERTRDYLVGLTVDAMDTGRDKFIRHRDPVRGRLERDVNRLYVKAGNPSRIPEKDLVAALNAMKHGEWKSWNNGRGLTESDLRELRKPPASGELHGIMPDTKVRTSFPNLPLTRNHAAKTKISICDAVAIALEKGKQKRSYEAVVSMYRRYKTELPVL